MKFVGLPVARNRRGGPFAATGHPLVSRARSGNPQSRSCWQLAVGPVGLLAQASTMGCVRMWRNRYYSN